MFQKELSLLCTYISCLLMLRNTVEEYCFFSFFFFCLFRAAPTVHGGSQARGQIRAVAAGLYHSHNNARFKLCLQPTPQLKAMPDP